jgi:hypothetical protein
MLVVGYQSFGQKINPVFKDQINGTDILLPKRRCHVGGMSQKSEDLNYATTEA